MRDYGMLSRSFMRDWRGGNDWRRRVVRKLRGQEDGGQQTQEEDVDGVEERRDHPITVTDPSDTNSIDLYNTRQFIRPAILTNIQIAKEYQQATMTASVENTTSSPS
jgi:hypothetical protein